MQSIALAFSDGPKAVFAIFAGSVLPDHHRAFENSGTVVEADAPITQRFGVLGVIPLKLHYRKLRLTRSHRKGTQGAQGAQPVAWLAGGRATFRRPEGAVAIIRHSGRVSRLAPRTGLMRRSAADAFRHLARKTASHCIEGARIRVGKGGLKLRLLCSVAAKPYRPRRRSTERVAIGTRTLTGRHNPVVAFSRPIISPRKASSTLAPTPRIAPPIPISIAALQEPGGSPPPLEQSRCVDAGVSNPRPNGNSGRQA